MSKPVEVARLDQLTPGAGLAVDAGRRAIALFLVDGEVHALDDMCPHSGAPLSEGAVEDGCVVCPWHGARFELASGRSVGEFVCRDAKRHVARVVGGVVELELAESAPRVAKREQA